jgi:hypothetical protein
VQFGDHQNDQNVGEKEAGYGDEQIGQKGHAFIIRAIALNSRANADRKRKSPGEKSANDEQGQAVQKAVPYFAQHGQIVAPGDGFASKQVPVKK